MDRRDAPQLVAVFVIIFDQKVGYTVSWKRTIPDLDLDGVEYKCLPSGLHTVKEDLVYFIQGPYAGISLFVQGDADAAHRNANFVAVGALVPLDYGMLGRGWSHVEGLRQLAKGYITSQADTRPLALYWEMHKPHGNATLERPVSPKIPRSSEGAESNKRKRGSSEVTIGGWDSLTLLPADHPVLTTASMLDTFGPLLFPLHRAALARKRILFLASPPVQAHCAAAYVLSVLSNVSQTLRETLPGNAKPLFRSRPLYSVGIHDIPILADNSSPAGYIACTTDDILKEKRNVWDLLVEMPSAQTAHQTAWPLLRTPDGHDLKATQRDLRRWELLQCEVRRIQRLATGSYHDEDAVDNSNADDSQALLGNSEDNLAAAEQDHGRPDVSSTVEATTWGTLAYKGFVWWASAGEAAAWERGEGKIDTNLLVDLADPAVIPPNPSSGCSSGVQGLHRLQVTATVVVAFMRRLTDRLLLTLAGIVEEADDQTEEGIEEDSIVVDADDLREMGLDTYSPATREFVAHTVKLWFDREAAVPDNVKLCGVRVC